MCGSNSQQQQISDAQQQMYQTLNQNYQTVFGQSQAITNALTAQFQPILAAGPSQQGFNPAEVQSLNTSATENIAQDYAAAQRATAQQLAAMGGGNTTLPSSVTANILAQNTNQAAAQRSSALNQITQANYQQGYNNWTTAANALSSTAGLLSPTSYAGASTSGGTAAANTANQIAQANNSVWNAAIGALGSIGGAAVGNIGGVSSLLSRPTQYLQGANPIISNYNSLQNLSAPFIPSYSATGGMGTMNFGA